MVVMDVVYPSVIVSILPTPITVEPEIVFFLRSEEQGLDSAVEGFKKIADPKR